MRNTNSIKQNCEGCHRRFTRKIGVLSVVLLALLGSPAAMHALTNTIQFVKIGDPGNPADARTGGTNGSVAYNYYISKYPVRNDQFAEFLNDVASAADPHALASGTGGARGGIIKTTNPDSTFSYTTKPNYANKPVNWTLFDTGCRFCNWLHN